MVRSPEAELEADVQPSKGSNRQAVPEQRKVADTRVRFLTQDLDDAPDADLREQPTVRSPILASWRRSQDLRVAADRIEMAFVGDVDHDTPLTRSAGPVLNNLARQLEGQSVSVILTDPSGLVLSRLTGDGDLERHLDHVLLAPGFSYAEKFVGTNGIGTALEVGGPAHVFGHEHYAENLEELACAGVPIHHPVSGRMVGAVDLTCWRKDAGALLLALAKTTAEQIRQALLTDTGALELALLREYLRTCSRNVGAVFAVGDDFVMLNEHARTVLDPVDQGALLAHASESPAGEHHRAVVVDLPTGSTARLYCRSVSVGDRPAGVVAHVKLGQPPAPARGRQLIVRMPLPGLVGTSPTWVHACQELERVYRADEWVALEGERGVGKLALLRAVQLRRQPVGRFVVLDAAEASSRQDWLADARRGAQTADTLVVRHVDLLDGPALRGLASALQEARSPQQDRRVWVAVTLSLGPKSEDLTRLLRLFPSTLDVPPLRLHVEDLPLLVPLFLSRLAQAGQLTCAPETLRLLMRMSWPGNVAQLHDLLAEVVQHRRTGSIEPGDLPSEAHTLSRRVLSPLESMERDAIIRCLNDAHGNKVEAARSLGMSRATIYRRIHEYGIVTPQQ
jgi:transcriptional regulator of acetoin/glycerol metabolism